jgi:hypothetical protein
MNDTTDSSIILLNGQYQGDDKRDDKLSNRNKAENISKQNEKD